MTCTSSAATATLPVHAGETLGVIKYERWKLRQGSIVAPMATKPTLPDGMCSPSLTSLLVGRTGCGSICKGGRILCQLHQFGPPLCGPPHRPPYPRTPRMGLVRGKSF